MPDRKIIITAADGQTGHLTADLLLTDDELKAKHSGVTLMCGNVSRCDDLVEYGPNIVPIDYEEDSVEDLVSKMEDAGADTIYLIPPASGKKMEFLEKMLEAAKQANIPNVLFLSSAGCDLAERETQPHLREFIDMEKMVMETKGDTTTQTGHSPVIIRAGFYAENLLLYNKNAQDTGKLPLPIGKDHKFAPLALGDLAHLAAVVLVSQGPHGFDDEVRGQLMVLTGPQMCAGDELAEAASQSLKTKMEYEEISPEKAREILDAQTEIDDSEKAYLLDYYSLVREGKTNYVSTIAFKYVTLAEPTLPSEFFESYSEEFKPKKRKVATTHPRRGRGAAAHAHAAKEEHPAPGHTAEEKGDKVGASNAQAKEKTTTHGKRTRK